MDTLFPLSLLGGIVLYLVRLWIERSSIQTALLIDINLILRRASETKTYLDREKHYWLVPGNTISHAPSDVPIKSRIFNSLLSKMYLLGKSDLKRVLAFYSHYQQCEALKRSLFKRIAAHVKSAKSLTDADVELLVVRRNRIANGLSSLINVNPDGIAKLRCLPTTYAISSTADTSKMVDHSITSASEKSAIVVLSK